MDTTKPGPEMLKTIEGYWPPIQNRFEMIQVKLAWEAMFDIAEIQWQKDVDEMRRLQCLLDEAIKEIQDLKSTRTRST